MVLQPGTYKVTNLAFGDRVLDLRGSTTSLGNAVIGYHWQNGNNQKASVLGRFCQLLTGI